MQKTLTKAQVATSKAVIEKAGPALELDSFANTTNLLSIISRYALLFMPSLHLSTSIPKNLISKYSK
jgi:hypothetical protein